MRREMIADHDNIREAIRETFVHRAGSANWRRAARSVVATGIDHLDREETGTVAESMLRLTMTRRCELGRQWCAFVATVDTNQCL
jgi:sarcosine oxidase delta subunit